VRNAAELEQLRQHKAYLTSLFADGDGIDQQLARERTELLR
jgi:hypothetical protein